MLKDQEKSPEELEAEELARQQELDKLAEEKAQQMLKDQEKSPEELDAEKKEIENTIQLAENSGFTNGVNSVQEQLLVEQKINSGMKKTIIDLQALVATQSNTKGVSGELMGNLQDKNLFDILVGLYPDDKFKDFSIGEPGADILHTVFHNGKPCGTITWESKRMEPHVCFSQTKWIKKLTEDKLKNKSSVAVFVANKFPKKDNLSGVELNYPNACQIKEFGYWYCSTNPHEIKMLSFGLRQSVITQASDLIDKDQLSVNEEIVNFVCGEEAKSLSDKVALHNSKADVHRNKMLELQRMNIKNAIDAIKTLNKYDNENQDILNLQSDLINKIHRITGQSENLIERTVTKDPMKLDNPLKSLDSFTSA